MKRLALLFALAVSVQAQTTTSIVDTLYNADGSLWTGTITITRDALRACPQGQQPRFSTVRTISAGVINLTLFPNLQPGCVAVDGGQNAYKALFAGTNGSTWTEWWGVPSSGSAIPLSKIQLGGAPPFAPTSVAPSQIQTMGGTTGQTLVISANGFFDLGTPDSCPTCPRLTIQAGAPTGACTAGYMVWDISTLPLITQYGCDNTQTWKQLGTRLVMQSGAPTGACTPSTTAWDISTDPITQYGCNSGGTWQELGSSGAGAYTGGDGIEIVDTTISADPLTLVQYVTSAGAPAGACTDGTLAFDTAAEQSYACINSAWVLISSSGATGGGYSQAFTSQTSVALTHALGTEDVVTACYDASEQLVEPDTIIVTDTDTVTVTFATAQTGRCVVSAGGGGGGEGTGDVTGPASSTDNAVARFNGTGGKTIQNSSMTVSDTGTPNIPSGQTYNINGAAHGHTGAEVSNTPAGNIEATTAQAAINELDTEKATTGHNHSGVYEPVITGGTTAQYWRGDKSFQTLDKSAVGLGNVDNTSDATKNAASATLANKTLTTPVIGSYTVAGLPAAGTANRVAIVTDAATSGSCTTGGGSQRAWCRDTGSAWEPIGDGIGAGGGVTNGDAHDHDGGDGAQIPTGGIVNSAITYAKIQNVSATDKLLGRSTAGAGVVEEIPLTAAGRALMDDADAAAQRTTLGLGNVDNTSDANKPISTATQAALDLKLALAGGTVTGNLTVQGDLISGDGTDAGEIVLQELAASGSNFRSWKVPDTLTADWTLQFPNAVATATESLLTFPAPTTGVSAMAIKEVTATNTASTVVARDGSGNFAAGTITAALTGNVTGSASLNLLLTGGTLTGALGIDNLGLFFDASDTNPSCGAGEYKLFADLSETTLKKCINGSVTDMDTTGAGAFGETSLAGLANSQTLWDGSQATRTLTAGLSGATDPVITFGNSLVNISTGDLQVAGNPVLSATSTTVGQVPRTTGTNTWAWGALDLADTDALTGVLPDANVATSIARLANPVFTGSVQVPNGTGPTVDAAGEIAVDTTSDQLQIYGAAKRALPTLQERSFVITAPVAGDDFLLMKAPWGMTIVAINGVLQGTTNVIGQVQECTSAGASCADLDADITFDGGNDADDGSLTDSAIAAGNWIAWKTTSVSGTPTFLTVTITFRVVPD